MEHTKVVKETLISEQQIAQRIIQLGKQITDDMKDSKLLVIGVLRGAWVYMADLVRAIDINCEVDFLCASSYGHSRETSGVVTITRDISADPAGKDVLLVEDIVDSGITLTYLKKLFIQRGAKSVKITALLSKPARRVVDIDVDYVGFEIPDKFVIGYGLDLDDKYRGLRDVCIVDEEEYQKSLKN